MSGSGNKKEDINLEQTLVDELKRIEAEMDKTPEMKADNQEKPQTADPQQEKNSGQPARPVQQSPNAGKAAQDVKVQEPPQPNTEAEKTEEPKQPIAEENAEEPKQLETKVMEAEEADAQTKIAEDIQKNILEDVEGKGVVADTIPIEIPKEFLAESQESFESKIERAMQQIVTDTVGDQPIKVAPKSQKAKKAKIDKDRERILQERRQRRLVSGKAVPEKKQKSAKSAVVKEEPAPVQTGQANEEKKHNGKKAAGITAAVVVLAAAAVYGGFTYYYKDRFFHGSQVNGLNCSGKTVAQTEKQISDAVEGYKITIKARGQDPQSISGSSIDYHYMADDSIDKLVDEQKPWKWITGFFETNNYKVSENVTYNKQKLQAELETLSCAQPENQEAPQNAYVTFKDAQFQIVPETQGTALDNGKALSVLKKSVGRSEKSIDLSKQGAYAQAEVKQNNPTLLAQLDTCNNYAKASITYTFGDVTEVLDGNTIKDWLTFDENGQFVQDDAAFRQHALEFVAGLAGRHDTVGKERNFHTTSGRDIVVGGGNYGWQINQEEETGQLVQEIMAGQTVSRNPVYALEGITFAENDIGNTYVEVDLSSQHMYYYQDGAVTFDSDFVSGNMSYSDRQTPTGVCKLYYKKRDEVLRGTKRPDGTYEYESPVSYWMPFNGGVGFHDANWRGSFGGDIFQTNGSHGCINLPPSNAAVLYDMIDSNVPIVVFY